MAAFHIVRINFELGLSIDFSSLRQQQRLVKLMAIGSLSTFTNQNLTLKDAARIVVERAFINFPGRAVRHRMIHESSRVDMLTAAPGIGSVETAVGFSSL